MFSLTIVRSLLLQSILLTLCLTLVIERQYTGDVIYGLNRRVCLNDFDNTIWKSREQSNDEGVCVCKRNKTTFMVNGCYDSKDVEENCSLYLIKPFGKIPLLQTIDSTKGTFYEIHFQLIYGLQSKAQFKECHANIARNNINNSLWEDIGADFRVINGRTITIFPSIKESLEGNVIRITFKCRNQKPQCTLVKTKGIIEMLENNADNNQVDTGVNDFVKSKRLLSNKWKKLSNEYYMPQSYPRWLTKTTGNIEENPQENVNIFSMEENIPEVLSKSLLQPISTTSQDLIQIKISKTTKQHSLPPVSMKKETLSETNPSSTMESSLNSIPSKTESSPINLTVVYCVLLSLVACLICVSCIIGERVYRTRQEDRLFKTQNLLSNTNAQYDVNQNIASVHVQERNDCESINIPKIVVEKASDVEDTSDADVSSNFRYGFKQRSPLRLSRSFSINLKQNETKRMSILDLTNQSNNDEEVQETPLFKKAKSRRK